MIFRFPEAPVIRIGVQWWPPHIALILSDNGEVVNIGGAMKNMLDILSDSMNFK